MKDLRNHEFVEVYSIITNYIEKLQVNDANLKIAFEMVKSHKMRLPDMGKRKLSSFSLKNKELTRKRNDYLISLRLRVKSYLLSHIQAERDAAQLIHIVMKSYGKKYYVPTILPQTQFASDLEFQLTHKKDFRDAALLLGLNDLLNTIFEMTVEIMANFDNRINENGETKSKREGVKRSAYRDMKIMADAINFMAAINQHNEETMAFVENLIDDIDGILKDFRTAMRSRNTKRKNRKEVATAMMKLASIKREERKLLPVGVGDNEKDLATDSGAAHSSDSKGMVYKKSESAPAIDDDLVMNYTDPERLYVVAPTIRPPERISASVVKL